MKIMTESEFRKEVKVRPATGYLFYGDEDYMKANALRTARAAVSTDESFAFFNDIRIDALDFTPAKLLDALMPPPMSSEKKLVTVSGLDFTAMRQSDIADICEVLAVLPEYDYNVLIINVAAGLIDEGYSAQKPSALLTKLGEYLSLVRFEKVSPARLCGWAIKHFEHGGVKADEKTARFFVDYCGGDMFRLSGEAEKLCAYVLWNGRDSVTEADIRNVCVSETDFDSFAFANAVMEGRNGDALEILDFLKFRRVDPLIIFGDISRTICDILTIKRLIDDGMTCADIGKAKIMNEYRAKIYARAAQKTDYKTLYRRIELCAETDRRLKLSPQGYGAIEMFICSE